MTDGVERARLRTYLTGAQAETSDLAGDNWRHCGYILAETAEALRKGATQIRDGEGDGQDGGLSGMMADALLAAFEDSSSSMEEKGTRLVGGGDALKDAARVMSNAKTAEAGMADLQQPPAYTAPTPLPGLPPTPKEIQAEANKRHAANQEMSAYNTARAQQEAAAAQWTQKLDAVFLGSIPPMQAIHGQPDPTEPPPSVPSSPSSPSLPPTGPRTPGVPDPTDPRDPKDPDKDPDKDRDKDPDKPDPVDPEKPEKPEKPDPVDPEKPDPVDPQPPRNPITTPTHPIHQVPGETSTIGGSSQSGVTYNPSAGQAPAGPSTGGSAGGMNAAAMGAAGAAGGASGMAGGIRAGAAPAPAGSSPARPIGATGRSGSAGALSRPASASGSAAARAGTAGSPAARGAGSAGARGAGSAGARGAGSAGARGAGSAGGRGAGSAGGRSAGSGTGSRSGGRGSTGARGAAGGANGRGGRKGDDDQAADRDSLVYEQDWLGDDDVAPGVLD